MDGKRFDELTRVMGAGASRRRVLKGFAAGIGGGLVALVGRRASSVFAANGDLCSATLPCTTGFCIPNPGNPANSTDATAGFCEQCNPPADASAVCAAGQYCDVNGTFGACNDCTCAANETCDPVGGACSCPNTICTGACCAAGQVCDVGGSCSNPGELHSPCAAGDVCNTGLYCIQGNCDVCSITPANPCANGLFCDVSGYWAACVDLCVGVTCAVTQTCDPGTGVCNCIADLCAGACCDTGTHCVDGACKGPSDLGGICSATDPCAAGLFCIPNGVNPDNANDPTAGYCEECNPDLVAAAVCAAGSFCNVSGSFGVCDPCACPTNETCAPVGGACGCDTVCCGATADVEGVCCTAGLVCGANGACVQCAADTDCATGQTCTAGMCVTPCATVVCGEACCATGEVCNSDHVCVAACDAALCGGVCCPAGKTCVADVCTTPTTPECTKDTDCPGDKVCKSGVCKAAEQGGNGSGGNGAGGNGASGNGSDTGNGAVTTLPTTGIGGSKSGASSSWLGAAAIGGAAALLAGKKLRDLTGSSDAE